MTGDKIGEAETEFTMLNYTDLYYNKEVKVDGSIVNKPYPIDLSIELRGLFDGNPDCRIGHFGYNFYIRTPYGIKAKAYKSEKTLQRAVEKTLKNKGFKVLGWVDKN